MILILMTSRSGSSLVSSIFVAHGFDPGPDRVFSKGYETFENHAVNEWIRAHKAQLKLRTGEFCDFVPGIEQCIPKNAVVKIGVEYLTLFEHLNPMVVTVKRDVQQIAQSLAEKRGHPEQAAGAVPGLKARMRAMARAREKHNGVEIDTNQIIAGDMSGVRAAFEHHGLEFDEAKARACIDPNKGKFW